MFSLGNLVNVTEPESIAEYCNQFHLVWDVSSFIVASKMAEAKDKLKYRMWLDPYRL